MKLTEKHIIKIRAFVKSKYVDFYDVQEELVDHIALSVEQKRISDPSLCFEKALTNVYQGFGIFGFSEFVEEKQEQAFRKGRKLFFKELITFFKLPQLLLTLLIGLFFHLAISSFEKEVILVICLVAILIPSFYGGLQLWRFQKSTKKELTQAKFTSTFLGGFGMFINVFNIMFHGKVGEMLQQEKWFLTILATTIFIALLAQIKAMKQVHSALKLEYPEAFSL